MLSVNDRIFGEIAPVEEDGGLNHAPATSLRADRKGPKRTCLGCRAKKKQDELRRLALDPSFPQPKVVWDPARRIGGRGVWLCRDQSECLNLALKKKVWRHAFRLTVEPDLAEIRPGLIVAEKK